MNNKLYGNLIFELSHPGTCGYSLPTNRFPHHEVPAEMRRANDAELPECDEMTVVRHYTNHSANNFGVLLGFSAFGSLSCLNSCNGAVWLAFIVSIQLVNGELQPLG